MSETHDSLKQLSQYARVARNAQMLLVMEPPRRDEHPEVEQARAVIASDIFDYLTEVQDGVNSPYFQTYTHEDAIYIDHIAIGKVDPQDGDHRGVFFLEEPKLIVPDTAEAQAASFAYLAASCMQRVRAPFYQAPTLRTSVPSPRNLSEFVDTVGIVKEVTTRATDAEFHHIVQRNDWRVAFAFWEANRWLAGAVTGTA